MHALPVLTHFHVFWHSFLARRPEASLAATGGNLATQQGQQGGITQRSIEPGPTSTCRRTSTCMTLLVNEAEGGKVLLRRQNPTYLGNLERSDKQSAKRHAVMQETGTTYELHDEHQLDINRCLKELEPSAG